MEFRTTKRGFLVGEFLDRYGKECSIQESSFADEDCIWLGVDNDAEGNAIANGRMHLTQAQARDLIPVLRHFARTGGLGIDDAYEKFVVGAWVRGVGERNHGVEGRITEIHVGNDMVVQDCHKAGFAGQWICMWDKATLIWEPIDVPASVRTRYDLIAADEEEDGNQSRGS
jgi:hypothetical protein